MINNILALAIRGAVVFILGLIVMIILQVVIIIENDLSVFIGIGFWVIGGIYALMNFNNSFNFGSVKTVEDKVGKIVDNKHKLKLEEEMLRINNLLEKNILTRDEYDQKMKSLKDEYL